jgi:hypothetical protein
MTNSGVELSPWMMASIVALSYYGAFSAKAKKDNSLKSLSYHITRTALLESPPSQTPLQSLPLDLHPLQLVSSSAAVPWRSFTDHPSLWTYL